MLHDYYTFTHSANVATYCVSVARTWAFPIATDLSRMAAGALLHDVGKRKIPRRVLNAPNKLSTAERDEIQRHPQIGFEELSDDPDLTWGQLMIVYQHHERLDGRGYPVGVVGDEIDPWAKICAVSDVFDALTCDRPYRAAMSVDEASEFLERRSGQQLRPGDRPMPDDNDAERMIGALESRVVLPADFFDKTGPVGTRWEDLRQFPRFYFRTAAALEIEPGLPALPRPRRTERVYVKDISRAAVAILHSEQLYPGERLRLTLIDGAERFATVNRCRRVQAECYEVAGLFDALEAPRAEWCGSRVAQPSLMTPEEVSANPHRSM